MNERQRDIILERDKWPEEWAVADISEDTDYFEVSLAPHVVDFALPSIDNAVDVQGWCVESRKLIYDRYAYGRNDPRVYIRYLKFDNASREA
jgi:hypothetical protein